MADIVEIRHVLVVRLMIFHTYYNLIFPPLYHETPRESKWVRALRYINEHIITCIIIIISNERNDISFDLTEIQYVPTDFPASISCNALWNQIAWERYINKHIIIISIETWE